MFIQNLLSTHTFRCRVNSTVSDLFVLQNGVPQGSVLAVTLFGLKIDSIVKRIGGLTESSLFVDDFCMP